MEFQGHGQLKSFGHIFDFLEKRGPEISVSIVANVKDKSPYFEDHKGHSLKTEFLADDELNSIISAFQDLGMYTEIFFEETKFLQRGIENSLNPHNREFHVVFSTAQLGKGAGRKALIPAFCNLKDINYTSSNPYVVGVCRQKFHYSAILKTLGFPTISTWGFHHTHGWLSKSRPQKGMKCIAKLAYESASIGISKDSAFHYSADSQGFLEKLSFQYKQPIIVQEFVEGYELEVPIIGNDKIIAQAPVGLELNGKKNLGKSFLAYDDIYHDAYNFYLFNEFGPDFNQGLQGMAEDIGKAIGITGFGRVDFRVQANGKAQVMDLSTNPHITPHSSYAYVFKKSGLSYKFLPGLLIGLALGKI